MGNMPCGRCRACLRTSHRANGLAITKLDTGQMGWVRLPNSSVRAIKLLRKRRMSATFPCCTSAARARAFISAILTPVGHTILHTRQPLQ